MASNARKRLNVLVRIDHIYNIGMAMAAGAFRNALVQRFDLDGLMKTPGRERQRMVEPIDALDRIFAKKVVRSMAIVADRDRMMWPTQPGFVMVVHDMAIRASLRIAGQIRAAFRINERVAANACSQTDDKSR